VLAHGAGQLRVPRRQVDHRGNDEAGGRARECADHDLAAHGLVLGGELGLSGVELREHTIGACDQGVGGGGQPDPTPVAFQ
jgi:hypothetical protein